MSSAILNITFDCADPERVARFWSAVTGWELRSHHLDSGGKDFSAGPPDTGGPRLYFVAVPEPKAVKNRVHLDVVPRGGQQQEIGRLVELGASVVEDLSADGGWVVMRDLEGNEFCVEPGS